MTASEDRLRRIITQLSAKYGLRAYANLQNTDSFDNYEVELEKAIEALIKEEIVKGRLEENESIEIVLEREIAEPDHCYLHDVYHSHCHACREKWWRNKFCKEYIGVIQDRLQQLIREDEN